MALNFMLRGEGANPPSSWYLALLTADPEITGMTEEVIAADYQRMPITFSSAMDGTLRNDTYVDFGTTVNDWGELTHYAIVDAATGGNPLVFGELTVMQAPTGTPVSLAANTLLIEMG